MTVTVSVFGRSNGIAIRNRADVLPAGTTVQALLALLEAADELPHKFGGGEGYSEYLVIVDGMNAMVGRGLEEPLHDGARVLVLPAIAGG